MIGEWPTSEQEARGAALPDLTSLGVVIAWSGHRGFETLSDDGGPLQYVGDRSMLLEIAEADWRSELARRFARLGIPIFSQSP